jgi:hypothetical protein
MKIFTNQVYLDIFNLYKWCYIIWYDIQAEVMILLIAGDTK